MERIYSNQFDPDCLTTFRASGLSEFYGGIMFIRNLMTTVLTVSVMTGLHLAPGASAAEQSANKPGKTLRLWYNEPAPDSDAGWVNDSIPMGNGYMGVNVFGGTTSDRIQITENSLYDWAAKNSGFKRRGLNNFAEVYIDFDHTNAGNYTRELNLNKGVSSVNYEQGGVTYSREYFTSYPDKVMVIRLNASEAGKLSFTLRPTIPFIGDGKTGSVSAKGDTVSSVLEQCTRSSCTCAVRFTCSARAPAFG